MMSQRSLSLITLLIITSIAGQAASQMPAKLEAFGLQGKRVTALGVSPRFSPEGEYLYAATEGEGVYRRALFHADSTWRSLGLEKKKITALDIQIWGAGPAIFHRAIVGVAPDHSQGDSTLIYRLESQGWVPADSGLSRRELYRIKSLASFESSGHAPPGRAFAGSSGQLFRSTAFVSRRWAKVFDLGIGLTNTIAVHPKSFGSEVWAGGETGIFAPWIARSTDEGETWKIFFPDLRGDNACNAIAIHPLMADLAYAGMEGAVIKTTDGGRTWSLTGLRNTPVYFYGLALDSMRPEHLYAGGTIAASNRWALWESFDAGAAWKEIPPPVVAGITQLLADSYLRGVVYIATSGHGVWRYQSVITAVRERHENTLPQNFTLEQNFPNPFSAAGRSSAQNNGTLIRFMVPAKLANQSARLAIYNVRGELVRELINKKLSPGQYDANWEGRDDAGREMTSGIYLCRLQIGNDPEMRKLTLLK